MSRRYVSILLPMSFLLDTSVFLVYTIDVTVWLPYLMEDVCSDE